MARPIKAGANATPATVVAEAFMKWRRLKPLLLDILDILLSLRYK
jgi:hypothetical protein